MDWVYLAVAGCCVHGYEPLVLLKGKLFEGVT
jgi:hypothetical protein